MSRHPLLIVGRRDVMDLADRPEGADALRLLAQLTRLGVQLVATASLTHDWSKNEAVSSRSRPGPKGLRQRIEEAGGAIDAVYYVPHSLLTQKTRREAALRDILSRFGVEPSECHLLSSERKFAGVAEELGIHARVVSESEPLPALLESLRERFAAR